MSFIQSLKFIQDSTQIDLKNLPKSDLIKIEKLLKVQQKFGEDFNNSSLFIFIEHLQTHKIGLSFLLENPSLIEILSNNLNFRKNQDLKFENENQSEIELFFKECLEEDLINCCNLSFSSGKYGIVVELLNYKNFLPETVLNLIESKTETKLDYYINIADKVAEDASVLSQPFMALVRTLNIKRLNAKKESLIFTSTSYSLKVVRRSGLSHFFLTMIDGFSWMGKEAETVQEKIEKREVLKDFKFMSTILGAIFVLLVSVVIYKTNEDSKREALKKEVATQKFKTSIYSYLTDFDTTSITNIEYLNTLVSGELSTDYFKNSDGELPLSNYVMVVNNSSYDLIILPDAEIMSEFGFPLISYYIKPNDSVNTQLLFNRIYVGKKIALFEDVSNDEDINRYHKQYNSKSIPRFLDPLPKSNDIIKKRFELRGRIELIEQGNALYIESNKSFRAGNMSVKTFDLKN